MRYILILLLCLTSYSQNIIPTHSRDKCLGFDGHKIDLHLQRIVIGDPEIITLRPINKIKVTFKIGLNVSNGGLDFYHILGYECRVKYYFNKKLRLVFKNQVLGVGQNYYLMGFQFKF